LGVRTKSAVDILIGVVAWRDVSVNICQERPIMRKVGGCGSGVILEMGLIRKSSAEA
jgi:hypothetical protein